MYFFLIRALTPHRARGIERVLPFVFALLLPLLLSLFFFAHYNRDFIFRTVVVVVYSLGFFPHRHSCLRLLLLLLLRHGNRQALGTRTRSHEIMLLLCTWYVSWYAFCYFAYRSLLHPFFYDTITASTTTTTYICRLHCRSCCSFPLIPICHACFLPVQRTLTPIFGTVSMTSSLPLCRRRLCREKRRKCSPTLFTASHSFLPSMLPASIANANAFFYCFSSIRQVKSRQRNPLHSTRLRVILIGEFLPQSFDIVFVQFLNIFCIVGLLSEIYFCR